MSHTTTKRRRGKGPGPDLDQGSLKSSCLPHNIITSLAHSICKPNVTTKCREAYSNQASIWCREMSVRDGSITRAHLTEPASKRKTPGERDPDRVLVVSKLESPGLSQLHESNLWFSLLFLAAMAKLLTKSNLWREGDLGSQFIGHSPSRHVAGAGGRRVKPLATLYPRSGREVSAGAQLVLSFLICMGRHRPLSG